MARTGCPVLRGICIPPHPSSTSVKNIRGKLESHTERTALGGPPSPPQQPSSQTYASRISLDCTGLLPPSPAPGYVPGGTDLPLVLGEQLGAAEEVLVPGERDDGLWELPKVELQQGGHCVHVCGAGRKGDLSENRTPGSCRTNTYTVPHMRPGQYLVSGQGVCRQPGSSGASCPGSRSDPGYLQAQAAGPLWGE